MLRRAEGTTPPSSTSSGVLVGTYSSASNSIDNLVHRADRDYAYALFACMNGTSCTVWYADGTGGGETSSNTTDTDDTQRECWELEGVTGETDVSSAVVDDPTANAPHIFFYPTTWDGGNVWDGRLALYYSVSGEADTSRSEIYYMLHDVVGWAHNNDDDFNDCTGDWDSPILVAEGPHSAADAGDTGLDTEDIDDYLADHPWAMLTQDNSGADQYVQLFVQSQHGDLARILQMESANAGGTDFGFSCTSSCTDTMVAGGATVAIDVADDDSTYWIVNARHSRVMWDYVADPTIDKDDASDDPTMLFQMDLTNSEGDCLDSGDDDIGLATGEWDTLNNLWEWSVDHDPLLECGIQHIEDGHDNSSIPLPDNQFKVYFKDFTDNKWKIAYWDGDSWEADHPEIAFGWNGECADYVAGTSYDGPDSECVENVSALVHVNGMTIHALMFFMLWDSKLCDNELFGSGLIGLDDDARTTPGDDNAIVAAELAN